MTAQQINEIVKALAYGETPDQVAAAEGVTVVDVQQINKDYAADIVDERNMLKGAGYIG